MIDAKEAKARSASHWSRIVEGTLTQVEKRIIIAIAEGNDFCYISPITPVVRKELERLGYTVTEHSSHNNEMNTVVSWELGGSW